MRRLLALLIVVGFPAPDLAALVGPPDAPPAAHRCACQGECHCAHAETGTSRPACRMKAAPKPSGSQLRSCDATHDIERPPASPLPHPAVPAVDQVAVDLLAAAPCRLLDTPRGLDPPPPRA